MTTASTHQDTARAIIRLREQAAATRAQAEDLQSRTSAAEQQAQKLADQLAKQNADQDQQLTELNETARELKKHPDLQAANEAVKSIKDDIGLNDVSRQIRERNQELTAAAADSPEVAELQRQAADLGQQAEDLRTEAETLERQAEAETARLIDDIAG